MRPVYIAALIGMVLIWGMLAPALVSANAAPPVPEINLYFANWPAPEAVRSGLQLHGCRDRACTSPVLLLASGRCSAIPCLPGEPRWNNDYYQVVEHPSHALTLHEDFLDNNFDRRAYQLRRLVLQFDDQAFSSAPFRPIDYRSYHRVAFQGDLLQISQDTALAYLSFNHRYAFYGLLLLLLINLLLEIPIGLVIARIWQVKPLTGIAIALLAVNLISYPLVWGFFPALTPFASADDRQLALTSLVWVVIVGGTIAGTTAIPRLRPVLINGGVILLVLVACMVLTVVRLPGLRLPVWGIDNIRINLALIELAVVLLEGTLLARLLGTRLSLMSGLRLALITNLASFLVGLVVWP